MGTGPSTNEGERISVQINVLYEKLLQGHSIRKSCEQSMFILFLFCELSNIYFNYGFTNKNICPTGENSCIIEEMQRL